MSLLMILVLSQVVGPPAPLPPQALEMAEAGSLGDADSASDPAGTAGDGHLPAEATAGTRKVTAATTSTPSTPSDAAAVGFGSVRTDDAPTALWTTAAPLAAIGLLGGLAVWLGRRRRPTGRLLELVETLSIGPRRQLVVVRFGGQQLLVAASDAGVHLVSRESAAQANGSTIETDVGWLTSLEAGASELPSPLSSPSVVASSTPSAFETALEDSVEDQALRQKLAAGFRGRAS